MSCERRQFLHWSIGLCAACALPQASAQLSRAPAPLIWRERMLLGFGTTLWIKAGHPQADRLEAALEDAVQTIRHIERQMSLFDPDSALSRLNARGTLARPDADLLAVLRVAADVSAASRGAFDVSLQPLWQLWSAAAAHGAQPPAQALARARQRVHWRAVSVDPSALRLQLPGMQLSLNGIAQGYAADRVRQRLLAHGIRHALIDTGEGAMLGRAPDGQGWTFEIDSAVASANPAPRLPDDGRVVATSSDAHTSFTPDRRHHHILDPRTGDSPPHWASVTVLAQRGAVADALTKVFFMLPPAQLRPAARAWQVDVVAQDKAGRWTSTLV